MKQTLATVFIWTVELSLMLFMLYWISFIIRKGWKAFIEYLGL